MDQKEIIERLKAGNKRFVKDMREGKRSGKSRRAEIVDGQNPFAIVLGCADSRIVPELAFDAGLGDLFVVRVAGNIANSSSIASIEFAVANLGVEAIIVLGHQNCGAVTAAVAGGDYGKHLNHLVAHIKPAIESCEKSAPVNEVAQKNAKLTVEALLKKSKIIRDALKNKKLTILPAYYHLNSGEVEWLMP
ncbi:MAG TPA: carbonic anhydrase [Bacteroidales bacterium]|nr:carbonic anhydrase [Bacteroidales bacterium]HPE57594.1 carbonic anhydrase [Bacteroidales bacterium]HRX96528.1 carbonic anhydrase [Bacteroidales bacterium]